MVTSERLNILYIIAVFTHSCHHLTHLDLRQVLKKSSFLFVVRALDRWKED